MSKKKPHKNYNSKVVYITKSGGMDWYQLQAQRKNIDNHKKLSEKKRKEKGK